jgi:signal transduction histidine kinase
MELAILVVTCIVNLSLGVFVLLQDSRTGFARSFALMTLMICAWTVSNYLTDSQAVMLSFNDIANKATYIFAYGIVLSGLIFTYYFPVKRTVRLFEKTFLVLISAAVLILSMTNLVAGVVSIDSFGVRQFSVGPILLLYVFAFVGILVFIARNELANFSQLRKKARRAQARIVLIAFSLSAVTGLLLSVAIPSLINDWYTAQLGPLATIVLVVLIVYAIARHGLFDVRLAIVRTSAYVLSLAALGGIYYVLAYVVSSALLGNQPGNIEQSPIDIGLALVLAFFFQPIKRLFDRFTNRVFYKDNYSNSDFFERLNKIVTSTTGLYELLRSSAKEIATTLKAEQVFFAIKREDLNPIIEGSVHHHIIPDADVKTIDKYVGRHDSAIVASILESNDVIRRLLRSHRVELVLPLTISNRRIGYLYLGEQKSSGYTRRDIRVLETISDELSVAIQNALAIEEIKALNATLQHRVDIATKELRSSNAMLRRLDKAKDDFISMASHQLRTPLTSVKGYISMVREGDAGKITRSQDQLLGQAFTSSERMVHLINDFLNVSRLQTGKFLIDKRPVDLAKVIDQELDSLATNAQSHNLSFNYKSPKDFPLLNLDEDKMRQVIMNFSDNAIYYSTEGSKIKVTLALEPKNAVFTVTDTGIGVPRTEQSQLFNKFYRASNARKQRPDGTGVGLYLAKTVIEAHGGKVVFESVEGKGSTFGFRLPLDELRARGDVDNLKD